MADFVNGFYTGNEYLNEEQMTVNAVYFAAYMDYYGWTKEACAGILGNAEIESTINPGVWQNLSSVDPDNGFGLLQWTPSTKYTTWCHQKGLTPRYLNSACERIIWEQENEGGASDQWIATSEFPMTFSEYKISTMNSDRLARAFLYCYERPADPAATEDLRIEAALKWYEVIRGQLPPVPLPGIVAKWAIYQRPKGKLIRRRR